MTNTPLRVLCLDIEGGFGGSSRSLEVLLRHIDRSRIEPEVWCRKEGPVQAQYRRHNIAARVTPEMPTISSLPRLSRNLFFYSRYILSQWPRARQFRQDLLEALEQRFDLLHCNHEALFYVGRWLRSRTRKPITFHVRTNLWDSYFARRQVRILSRAADQLVFITENERNTIRRQLGSEPGGRVIFNAVESSDLTPEPLEKFENDTRFKIANLSNYTWTRGTDRLVDIAENLAANGRRDVLFIVAGDVRLTRSLPGELGRVARAGGSLEDYAASRGVADMFAFLGHVNEPERVLATSDALIKPTREANPWGRDIIEALALARPVMTVGSWSGFVSNGETGVLQNEFDPGTLANEIAALADDRAQSRAMGKCGQTRIATLCNPHDRAADLANLWQETARAGRVLI